MEELEKNKNEILTLYNAIPKESEDNMKHYVDLRDIKIESREDLVKTCQVFRNPRFETFRFIYMRGNEIVNYESVTSRLPNRCDVFRVKKAPTPYLTDLKAYEDITRRMYRLGADGYYLMHNHPSGNVTPSEEDNIITKQINKVCSLCGISFLEHIIIGSDGDYYSYAEHQSKELVRMRPEELGFTRFEDDIDLPGLSLVAE